MTITKGKMIKIVILNSIAITDRSIREDTTQLIICINTIIVYWRVI